MFSFKTRLLFFMGLTITVVIVVWLYSQKSFSEFDLNEPVGSGNPNPQNSGMGTVLVTLTPTPGQNSILAPTANNAALVEAGCTLALDYWLQNQTKIPPQILVRASSASRAEVCVNYAESEICTILGEVSSAPDIILRQQFLVAIMNYLSGADTGAVADTINDAYEWLRAHLFTPPDSEEELQTARLYAQTLQSYNQGSIGPGACDVEVVAVVPDTATLSSATPGLVTGGAAPTLAPTLTSAPTARATVIIIVPTSTEPPDQEPEPTNTSPPPPPDTQPAPTDTQIPPPPPTEPATPTPVSENPTPTPVP